MGTTLCSYYQVSVTCSSIFRVILLFFCFFFGPSIYDENTICTEQQGHLQQRMGK